MEYSEEYENRSSKTNYEEWFKDDSDTEELENVYNSDDYVSGPIRVENGTVPVNIIEFHHSYAYDCQRYFNLCVADPDTVIFASGNLIHFFDTSTGDTWFRRCSTGGGIGHIAKNPVVNHIAVGENGEKPPIIIYEWPSMKIFTVLKEGTMKSYSYLSYSSDGRLLVSQGEEPDFMITVWNWKKSKILLHCKSHSQEVYTATFSPTMPGHLTTSGAGHIKFWQMARTFTGLKLQGKLGRFGQTEISDIVGVYAMPDEKVVSGCEWGNILLWEEDLIKFEICKKNRKPCHAKFIVQFEYLNGELITIGTDGWIRVWYYETIDQADPPDEDRFLENEPIYEFPVKDEDDEEDSMLMSIQKKDPDDPAEHLWYAQDGNGGIWLVELGTFEEPRQTPRKLLTCHAGPIIWMDVSTWGPFVATIGRDGNLHVYNFSTKRLILVNKFREKGSRVVWLPCSVEATGSTLVCAFESGVVRLVTMAILEADKSKNIKGDYSRLIQAIKPHKLAITAMSLNSSKKILVTGSEDSTIFAFSVTDTDTYPFLVPIGYIKLFSGVSCMSWNPKEVNTVLIGCMSGDCTEVELPDEPQDYTEITYELVQCEPRHLKFRSVKSKIRRELARLEHQKVKDTRIAAKREKMEKILADNPGIFIDEEEFLMDDEDDFQLPEIYVPKVPNRVLIANYTNNDSIWLSMAGYDSGYIYEYPRPRKIDSNKPLEPTKSTMLFDADDTEINSCLFYKNTFVFLGMEGGKIRVCRVNPRNHTDFSDYLVLPMHDNKNGSIPVILLSCDRKILLTCGHDGNLFSYNFNDETEDSDVEVEKAEAPRELPSEDVEDIEEPDQLTLEEVIMRSEKDRILAVAKRKKEATLKLLRGMTEEYRKIIERNSSLPKSQQIPHEEFELDPRITADLKKQLNEEMEMVHKKMAYDVEKSRLRLQKLLDHFVEPITCLPFAVCRISKPDTMVHSLRERKLSNDFSATYSEVVRRIQEQHKPSSQDTEKLEKDIAEEVVDVKTLESVEEEDVKKKVQEVESFLKGLSPDTIEHRLGVQINQLLRKYRMRKQKMEERAREWKLINASKPDPTSNHPDDIEAIKRAKETIGDYKLKVFPDFSQSQEHRETTLTKYKQMLDCRKKTFYRRENFNDRLRAVRDKKLLLQTEVYGLIEKLKEIQAEIPERRIQPLPMVPEIDFSIEFPEKNLELGKYMKMAERVKETKRRKMSVSDEIIINPMDEEYEVLLLDEKLIEFEIGSRMRGLEANMPEKMVKAQINVPSEILKSLNANDRAETLWEREMKRVRVMKKVYEQDSILKHIERSYEQLDNQLDELERERLDITADTVYANLFLLTLHQELIILKDFESMENLLMKKVKEKKSERDASTRGLQLTNSKIDQKNKEISKLQERIRDLQIKFNRMVSDNKFSEFLRKIFKKKYKPPKDDDEDSSSSSSDSGSSTEEDDASIASEELLLLHLNENVCPAGCDQELYDSTFSMRDERYSCENQMKEAQKIIEVLSKEVDIETKKLRSLENELKSNQKDLQDFMREKQRKLNDVDVTVILKFHQLQHFIDENNVADIRDCVVFDRTKLSELYTRVGELQQETFEQQEKHKKNRTHLHRMQVDCKHMESEIKDLKERIKQEMIKKFGREVSLDALYEAVLRRMVFDIKVDMREMTKEYDKQIRCVKDKYYKQLEILETLIQENTEKLSFLTVLEDEQMRLKKILRHPPESEDKILKIEAEYNEDLERLEAILKSQKEQKELFQRDIRNLRLKSRALPPMCTEKRMSLMQKMIRTSDEKDVISVETLDLKSENEMFTEPTSLDSDVSEKIEKSEKSDEKIVDAQTREKKDSQTALMVQHLLSKVMEGSMKDSEIEGTTREIVKEIMENLPTGGGIAEIREGIENSIDRIIGAMPREDDETMEAMRATVKESLYEIVARFEEESRDVELTDVAWNMKQKVRDLLESLGIKRDTKIETTLIKYLRSDPIETAIDYLSRNVQTTSDVEMLDALREHAFRTLTEIKEEMENDDSSTNRVDIE